MQKVKRGEGLTRRQKKLIFGGCLVLFLAVLAAIVLFIDNRNRAGNWLTASMQKIDSSIYFIGPDLTDQVSAEGQLHHYYKQGEYIRLEWVGYRYVREFGEYANEWHVPEGFVLKHPLWRWNDKWRLDFWWPERRGLFPPGAVKGTSSH